MFDKFLISLILFQVMQSSATTDYYEGLIELPDELNEIPVKQLSVVYNGKEVQPGEELLPHEVADPPQLFWPYKPNYYYNLIMCDMDSPSRYDHSLAMFLHWLAVNIPGMDVDQGDTIAVYGGGLPQNTTGSHRYILLVFESPQMIVCDKPRSKKDSLANRGKFNLTGFRDRYGFNQIYAGNYYVAQWEPYVDEHDKYITD